MCSGTFLVDNLWSALKALQLPVTGSWVAWHLRCVNSCSTHTSVCMVEVNELVSFQEFVENWLAMVGYRQHNFYPKVGIKWCEFRGTSLRSDRTASVNQFPWALSIREFTRTKCECVSIRLGEVPCYFDALFHNWKEGSLHHVWAHWISSCIFRKKWGSSRSIEIKK
jgi:hypothetical protein